MQEAFDETREDGGDHTHGEHVEGDGEEDEGGCGAAARGRMCCEGRGVEGRDGGNELRLAEERVWDLVSSVWGAVGHEG